MCAGGCATLFHAVSGWLPCVRRYVLPRRILGHEPLRFMLAAQLDMGTFHGGTLNIPPKEKHYIILLIGTPTKGAPIFGNPHMWPVVAKTEASIPATLNPKP